MNFDLFMPVRLISGRGCVSENKEELRSLGQRCVIVTGKHSAEKSGALCDITAALTALGVSWKQYDGIAENPLLSSCFEAADCAREFGAQYLIGIGGGSVMDASKAAAWIATNPGASTEDVMAGALPSKPLPLVLIGTTAGTGSEVTPSSVLTMDDTGHKRSLVHPNCYANLVFADPVYTHTMSRSTTVSTAFDAFCHAAEGWFAPACGDVITAFGEKALPLMMEGLVWLSENDGLPDERLRESIYYGSLYAGLVINATGTAFPHPLGYVLTEDFDIPHGMACAVYLQAFLQRAEQFAAERAGALYALCGGKERLNSVTRRLLSDEAKRIAMTEQHIAAYCARWQSVKNFERSPGGYDSEEAGRLLRELFLHD